MSFQRFENIMSNNAVVSFDLIDTLIEKPFINQKHFFDLMSQDVIKILGGKTFDFTKVRLLAEENTIRNKLCYDLNDIYKEFQSLTDFNSAIIMEIEKLELCYEQRFYQIRPIGIQLYQIAKQLNKKIILVAETHLPRYFIESFIEKNNLFIDQLFISNELGLTKKNGELFQYVLDKMHCSPQYLLHIGANEKTDFFIPQKLEINTFPLLSSKESYCNSFYYKKVWKENEHNNTLSTNLINGLFSINFFQTNSGSVNSDKFAFNHEPERFGYLALGPILLSFCMWLTLQSKNDHVKQLIFINDSSKLFKQAFSILKEGTIPQFNEFHISNNEINSYYQQYKFNILDKFPKISSQELEIIQGESLKAINTTLNKLKQVLIPNQEKVAIVDIYSSNIQNILASISKQKINGYYLSTRELDLDNIKRAGLSSKGFLGNNYLTKVSLGDLFYCANNSNKDLQTKIHNNALQFIKDFTTLFNKNLTNLYFSSEQTIMPGVFFLENNQEKTFKFLNSESLLDDRSDESYQKENDHKLNKSFFINKIIQKFKKEL